MMYKILNITAFAVMILLNYLANALPLNGKTTGELSAQYPNLFVPAGITFSIWGIIYLMLLVFLVLQFRDINKSLVTSIGFAFVLSSIFNAGWILAWHYEQLPLSILLMLGILLSLVFINLQLSSQPGGIIKAAFGIYLGWICIATIANVTALLVNYNWGGWGISEESWAIIMIATGAFITAIAMVKLNNPFLALAVVWAFVGIIINRQSDYLSIVIAAAVSATLIAGLMAWMFMKRYSL